MDLKLNKEKPS